MQKPIDRKLYGARPVRERPPNQQTSLGKLLRARLAKAAPAAQRPAEVRQAPAISRPATHDDGSPLAPGVVDNLDRQDAARAISEALRGAPINLTPSWARRS